MGKKWPQTGKKGPHTGKEGPRIWGRKDPQAATAAFPPNPVQGLSYPILGAPLCPFAGPLFAYFANLPS